MSRAQHPRTTRQRPRDLIARRPGIITVLSAFVMVICFAFVSFAVDTGLIVLTKTQLQNAVDAASLAAAQEVARAVYEAGQTGQEGSSGDAVAAARAVAVEVAQANGVFVDAEADVQFGNRKFDPNTNSWPITWGTSPFNTIRVTARREKEDLSAPDGRLKLNFGWAVNKESVALRSSGTAYIEARDMVLVMDFSGSMNDDSTYAAFGQLGRAAVEANMLAIANALETNLGTLPDTPDWPRFIGAAPTAPDKPQIYVTWKRTEVFVESSLALNNVVLQFTNGNKQTFSSLSGMTGTFKGTGSNNGRVISKAWVKSGNNNSGEGTNYGERFEDTTSAIMKAYGLDDIPYPYPSGSWSSFISDSRSSAVSSAGYRYKYGKLNFVNYLLTDQPQYHKTPDLWKTPHYPFHAIKEGATLFTQILDGLNYDDELGLVSYDDYSRVEKVLNTPDASVDLSGNPITNQYHLIDTIQRHKQASHYYNYTAVGSGLKDARELLAEHAREGAKQTIILMTDGLANRKPSGWSLPNSFKWSDFTDYDDNGTADYTTSDSNVQYAFYEATMAIKQGCTIHTISVGAGGDRDLMQAIAFAGGGEFVDVPGGTTIAEMEDQMRAAFALIASKLPPPKLVYDFDGE